MDWIRQYAAADHEFFKNGFNPHNFAELTAFHFLDTLAHSNHTRAVYLETDAVPVFGFRHKFTGFLRQLEAVMPVYDIAFLGTCCDLEKHVRLYDAISPNIHLSRGTRCFNAVLITREAARRVLAHGALSTRNSLWAIDHLFIVYIQDLPLHSLWASEPLFYEESKIPTEYMCP